MTDRRMLVATRNPGKLAELRPMFASIGVEVVDLDEVGLPEAAEEEGLEAFDTFEANALAKARYFHDRSGGLPTVADDSGLVVDALGGRPGVKSKRFSGRTDLTGAALDAANIRVLLGALDGVTDRRARFVCSVALVRGGEVVIRRGVVEGRILDAPVGTHGFGYDPVFFAPELGATFGEASDAAKARVSHRARAFAALAAVLEGEAGGGSGGGAGVDPDLLGR